MQAMGVAAGVKAFAYVFFKELSSTHADCSKVTEL